MSASFTFQASRSYRIYFVTAQSQWTTTASCAVPRISGKPLPRILNLSNTRVSVFPEVEEFFVVLYGFDFIAL